MSPSDDDLASRDWAIFDRDTGAHWENERRTRGPLAAFHAGAALREHARAVRPDWPSEADRARDLADHLELLRILERVPARGR
jgi:hypothetical protein